MLYHLKTVQCRWSHYACPNSLFREIIMYTETLPRAQSRRTSFKWLWDASKQHLFSRHLHIVSK